MESKGLKVNIRKAKGIVCALEGELFKIKTHPCGDGGRRVTAKSVLYTKCYNWVHGRYAKRVTARLAMGFVCLFKM